MDVHKSLLLSKAALEKLISESTSAFESLTNLCHLYEKAPLDLNGSSQAVVDLDVNIGLMSKYCAAVSSNIMCLESFGIPWLGKQVTKLDMTFLHGSDPWEFFVSYSNQGEKKRIINMLQEKHTDGGLLVKTLVKENDIVAINDGLKFYRAMVTAVLTKSQRARVLDIDTNKEAMVKLTNVYQLPSDVAAIPCQVLKCCLNAHDDNLRSEWCKELEILFMETLADCCLTVDVLEKIHDELPPKVLVNLYAWNERLKKEINFSQWINMLLTNIKAAVANGESASSYLTETDLDPFCEQNEAIGTDVISDQQKLTEKALDTNTTVCAQTGSEDPLENEHDLDEPGAESINLAVHKVSSWMNNHSMRKIANKQHSEIIDEPKEPSFNIVPTAETSQLAQPIKPVVKSKTPSSSSHSRSSQGSTKMNHHTNMSPDAREFVPQCAYIDLQEIEDTSNIVANLEEEYQPKDERRVCLYYRKHGHCDLIGCNKEHEKRTNKWTTDCEETNVHAFNTIDLPHAKSSTVVQVHHINNGSSFYGTLDNIYSAIDEHGVQETFESLYADLNSPENSASHPLLKSLPSLSQAVLALGLQRSLGPRKKWLRVVVTECWDNDTFDVFYVDFGNVASVKLNELREIRPQFLHLPFQAVLIFLSGIKINSRNERKAVQRLNSLIKGKYVKVEVVSRDIFNSQLDVIAYTPGDVCLNNLMVEEELCLPV